MTAKSVVTIGREMADKIFAGAPDRSETIVITRAALVQLLSVAAFEGYELCSWDVQRALTATGKPESPCS